MDLNKSNMKKIALLITFAITVYMILKNLNRLPDLLGAAWIILEPILLGFALAFILNVLVHQIETRLFAGLNRRFTKTWPKFRRPLSVFLSLLVVLGAIALILFIVVPELVRTITSLTNQIPQFFNKLQSDLTQFGQDHPAIGKYFSSVQIDWSSISQMLAQNGQKIAGSLVNSTVAITTNVFHAAITSVLSFVIAMNILMQKEKLEAQVKKVLYAYLPAKFTQPFLRLCSMSNKAFSNYIAGTCTEACILGTLCFIGMNIFRFPYALLVSTIVVFMALIPIIGSFMSTVIGALLILIVSPIQAIWYIVFFNVLQQLEGNLIFPHVVGSRVGLPGLWVLIAITIGGNLFGVPGMLISIPLGSVLYTLLRENVNKRLGKKNGVREINRNMNEKTK